MSTRAAKQAEHHGLNLGTGLSGPIEQGVIMLDGNGRVDIMTDTAARLLGLKNRPRRSGKVLLPAVLQEVVSLARSRRQTLVARQLELAAPGLGRISLSVEAMSVGKGKSRAPVLLLLQDLTAAPRVEQNLRQLDRLASLGALSAGIAHEIKNALVVGKTFFDSLLEKHGDSELVDLVRRELGRIDSLVSQMLQFAAPAEPAISEIHLHEVLNHSLRLVEPQLKDKGILLDRSFGAADDTVQGNPSQLEQAFVNLLLNAIDAMGPNGHLMIATETDASKPRRTGPRKSPGQLRVTVKDDGIGIPPENMGRLFGPFFTTKERGSGLGLSITRRILHGHGGVITVQSKPNQGATFHILLPAYHAVPARVH